jgi:AI-2 transport protein TqsA
MTYDGPFARLYKPLVSIAALIIIFWALNLMSYVVTILLLAFFINVIVAPYLSRLQDRGLSHGRSLLVVMSIAIVVYLALVVTIAFSMADLIDTLPGYQTSVQSTITATVSGLAPQGADLSGAVSGPASQVVNLIGSFAAVLKSLVGGLTSALLILLVFALFLLDADRVPRLVQQRFPGHPVLTTFGLYNQKVRSYFVNTAIVNIVIAGASTILLFLLRVPNPLLWGMALFIMRFVPVIGIWFALIPLTFTALDANGPQTAILVFVGIGVISGITSNTLYYRLMGSGLNLSPAAMFVSVLFWTVVLGFWGAVLALPLTLLLKMLVLDDDAKVVSAIISSVHTETSQIASREGV